MVLPKPCLRRPVTGLVGSGQGTSEGHATHGIADQTPVALQTRGPVQDNKNTTSLATPGPATSAIESEDVEDEKQNTIDGS